MVCGEEQDDCKFPFEAARSQSMCVSRRILRLQCSYHPVLDVQLPPGVVAPRYNLAANLRHEGGLDDGTYTLHLFQKAIGKWFNVQDLIVEEVETEPIVFSEAYLQIYERIDQ